MKKNSFTVPEECKITDLTGFIKVPDWIDVKIDPPVEVRPIDEIIYTLEPEMGIVKVYLRRWRSRWWKLIGTNVQESRQLPKKKEA